MKRATANTLSENSRKGAIVLETKNRKIMLTFGENCFDEEIETIVLTDPVLSNVWGRSSLPDFFSCKTETVERKLSF